MLKRLLLLVAALSLARCSGAPPKCESGGDRGGTGASDCNEWTSTTGHTGEPGTANNWRSISVDPCSGMHDLRCFEQ